MQHVLLKFAPNRLSPKSKVQSFYSEQRKLFTRDAKIYFFPARAWYDLSLACLDDQHNGSYHSDYELSVKESKQVKASLFLILLPIHANRHGFFSYKLFT